MNRFIRIVSAAALTLACHAPAFADDSLYAAFGEKAGLRLLVEDLWVRVKADERLAPFFKDTKRDNLVEQLTDQLCQVSGGPCRYEGGKMGPVHEDMKIGRGDFNALVDVLQQAMDARGVPFAAQNRLLARLAPMHRQIVTR